MSNCESIYHERRWIQIASKAVDISNLYPYNLQHGILRGMSLFGTNHHLFRIIENFELVWQKFFRNIFSFKNQIHFKAKKTFLLFKICIKRKICYSHGNTEQACTYIIWDIRVTGAILEHQSAIVVLCKHVIFKVKCCWI